MMDKKYLFVYLQLDGDQQYEIIIMLGKKHNPNNKQATNISVLIHYTLMKSIFRYFGWVFSKTFCFLKIRGTESNVYDCSMVII